MESGNLFQWNMLFIQGKVKNNMFSFLFLHLNLDVLVHNPFQIKIFSSNYFQDCLKQFRSVIQYHSHSKEKLLTPGWGFFHSIPPLMLWAS